jgi:hypothetical protein
MKTFSIKKHFSRKLISEMTTSINLDAYRKLGDSSADNFVENYFKDLSKKSKLFEALKNLKSNQDLDKFLIDFPDADWFITDFEKLPFPSKITQTNAVKFYLNKKSYILQLLGLLSLPYCYAAADGAKVLYQTERMYKDVQTRLEETAEFIQDLMNLNAFESSGNGKAQIFKVRIMHAAARYYILKGNWDLKYGFPVNQEDMAGTNLSFSLIVIRGLRKMGFAIDYQQQMDYIKYWSYVGALLGVKPELLPDSGKEARDLDQQIAKRQFKKSDEGIALTNSLLKCFYSLNDEKQITNKEIAGFMRFLLEDEVADLLEIPVQKFPVSKQFLLKLKTNIT